MDLQLVAPRYPIGVHRCDLKRPLLANPQEGSRRSISLDPETVTALRHHKAVQAKVLLASGPRADNLMFAGDDGEHFTPSA